MKTGITHDFKNPNWPDNKLANLDIPTTTTATFPLRQNDLIKKLIFFSSKTGEINFLAQNIGLICRIGMNWRLNSQNMHSIR